MVKASQKRTLKTLEAKIRDLDHHQFLLRTHFHELPNDPAHLKALAAELRVLFCLSSGTEGLLWRLCDELGVDDSVTLVAPIDVNRDAVLNGGVQFWEFPFGRPNALPPQFTADLVSLRKVIKEHESVFLASLTIPSPPNAFQPAVPHDRLTHEKLIRAVAEQMGSAHEDEGLGNELLKLSAIHLNGMQPYARRLWQYADLALQLGERVLDHAERSIGYRRQLRRVNGNVSFTLRFRPNEEIIAPVRLATIESQISEVILSVLIRRRTILIETSKHGVSTSTLEVGYVADLERRGDVLAALIYSSQTRQARVIAIPGDSLPPVDFNLGWLEAKEIVPISAADAGEPHVTLRWLNLYERLLSSSDCEMMMQLSPDAREMSFHSTDEDAFPP